MDKASSDELEQVESFLLLIKTLLAMLIEAVEGADRNTMKKLGGCSSHLIASIVATAIVWRTDLRYQQRHVEPY